MTIIVKAKNELILGNLLCGYGSPNLIEFTTEIFPPHNQTKCTADCASFGNLSQHLCIYLKLTDKLRETTNMSIVTLKTLKMLVISDDNGNSEYHSIIIIITMVTVLLIMRMTVKKRRLSLVLTRSVIIRGEHSGAVPGMRTLPPS